MAKEQGDTFMFPADLSFVNEVGTPQKDQRARVCLESLRSSLEHEWARTCNSERQVLESDSKLSP